ncbi:unnamed protein product [Cercopithifilaria johnstoni]|uniref:Uncharacterized protein n=1 Tax=Cercopithifilaria johnstoni TaxID=2874296 RepID=A0A8J2M7K3_9BILA|nr:unnamed protein product [Cercopithifilaria johnstoni]
MKSELIPSFTLLCVFSMLVMLVLSDLPQKIISVNGSNPDDNTSDDRSSDDNSGGDNDWDDGSSDDSSIEVLAIWNNEFLNGRIVNRIRESFLNNDSLYDSSSDDDDAFVER